MKIFFLPSIPPRSQNFGVYNEFHIKLTHILLLFNINIATIIDIRPLIDIQMTLSHPALTFKFL